MSELERERELGRVESGLCVDPPPAGLARFEIHVSAPSAVREVLERVREVFKSILQNSSTPWPTDEAWSQLLPDWFVDACAPERSREEMRAWWEHVQSLPADQREKEIKTARWSVGQFVHWFRPEQRQWWWWGAEVIDSDRLRICLVTQELMPSHAALDWLVQAAGAQEVVDENVRDLRDGGGTVRW